MTESKAKQGQCFREEGERQHSPRKQLHLPKWIFGGVVLIAGAYVLFVQLTRDVYSFVTNCCKSR